MKSRCLVRLWTMRMTPRQDVELFVVQMAMAVVVMLVGCIGMVMRIIMVMAMLIVLVVTMHVIVLLDAAGGFVSDPQLVDCLQKSAPFDPQQPCTEKCDEAVADDLNHANGVAHQLRGRAKENGGHRDDGHRGQGLHDSRGERQRDTSAPCLLIGEQVRGNHRLAMSRPCRVKNAVHKRDTD